MDYKVKGNAENLDHAIVSYRCEKCRARLKSPLSDAGTNEQCPECGIPLLVPGNREYQELVKEKKYNEKHAQWKKEQEKQQILEQHEAHKALLEYQEKRAAIESENRGQDTGGYPGHRQFNNRRVIGILLGFAGIAFMVGGWLSNPGSTSSTLTPFEVLVYKTHPKLQRTIYLCTGMVLISIGLVNSGRDQGSRVAAVVADDNE